MRRFLIALAFVLVPAAASAQTSQSLTARDIIELTRADLGEEALLALIDVNRPVFPIDVVTLKALKEAGVPASVITAMIKSGRMEPDDAAVEPMDRPASPVSPVPDSPQVVVIEHRDEPRVREVPVPVPIYVAVPIRGAHDDDDHHGRPPVVRPVQPVFWGWGGKLRPDAWKPAIERQKDAKIPLVPQRK